MGAQQARRPERAERVANLGEGASNQLQLVVCSGPVLRVWASAEFTSFPSGDGEPIMEVAQVLDRVVARFIGTKHDRDIKKLQPIIAAINAHEAEVRHSATGN